MKKDSVIAEPVTPEITIDGQVSNFFIARFHQHLQHIRWNDAMNRVDVVFTHDVEFLADRYKFRKLWNTKKEFLATNYF